MGEHTQFLISQWIAPSTARVCDSGKAAYLALCTHLGMPPFPASEDQLLLFGVELAQTVMYSIVWMYLAGVRHLYPSWSSRPTATCASWQLSRLTWQRFGPIFSYQRHIWPVLCPTWPQATASIEHLATCRVPPLPYHCWCIYLVCICCAGFFFLHWYCC